MKQFSTLSLPGTGAFSIAWRARIAIVAALACIAEVPAAGLNDTGQSSCYNATGAVVACALGAQDGRYGRDAFATAGLLSKVGAGAAGFDYTKIGNNGLDLPASATLGTGPTNWACTRDNVSGLTWEVKTATNSDLRFVGHTYTWYSTAANNGGNAGVLGTNTCNSTLAGNQCNTTAYAQAVNTSGLCGNSNWRLPTIRELQSLVNFGAAYPAIDVTYFPNTQGDDYWSATTYPFGVNGAYAQSFGEGRPYAGTKDASLTVRLVRTGP